MGERIGPGSPALGQRKTAKRKNTYFIKNWRLCRDSANQYLSNRFSWSWLHSNLAARGLVQIRRLYIGRYKVIRAITIIPIIRHSVAVSPVQNIPLAPDLLVSKKGMNRTNSKIRIKKNNGRELKYQMGQAPLPLNCRLLLIFLAGTALSSLSIASFFLVSRKFKNSKSVISPLRGVSPLGGGGVRAHADSNPGPALQLHPRGNSFLSFWENDKSEYEKKGELTSPRNGMDCFSCFPCTGSLVFRVRV